MTTQPLSALTMLLSRHTRRREFITLIGGAAAAAWQRAARAQQPAMPTVGFLSTASAVSIVPFVDGFRRGLGAPRIEAIVLGQHAARAGELTKLVRVDTSHRQPRCEQGTDDSALVTTARLKANCGDCERAQPCDQLGPAGCVVTYRKEPPLRQHHHVQAVLRHVD